MPKPEAMIFGAVPQAAQKMAEDFATKLLIEHQHCLNVTEMRYSIIPTKQHNSYEFLARIFHDSSIHSCTHKAIFSLGSDQDAQVPDHPQPIEGTASVIPARVD